MLAPEGEMSGQQRSVLYTTLAYASIGSLMDSLATQPSLSIDPESGLTLRLSEPTLV